MSNLKDGGIAGDRKKEYVAEGLEEVSADILDMMFRIMILAQSGLE